MAITDGLISYYKLDGDATDVLGTNNGTSSNVSWVAGKINNGGSFNGSSAYISVPDSPSLRLTTLTISMWINISGTKSTEQALLRKDTSGTRHLWGFVVQANTTNIQSQMHNGTQYLSNTYTLSIGTWTNVIMTISGSGGIMNFYVNGTKIGNSINLGNFTAPTSQLVLARYPMYGGGYFNGLIDEVGIWNRVLTQDEITQLYNGGNGMAYPFTIPYGIVNEPTRTRYRNELGQIDSVGAFFMRALNHTKNFDSTADMTNQGRSYATLNYNGLTVSGGVLTPNSGSTNDCRGHITLPISSYSKWKCQARIYTQPSSWGEVQWMYVLGGVFPLVDQSNRDKSPGHCLNMTSYSGYTGVSGIGDGSVLGSQYSGGGGFSGRYVYEIQYENGVYTMTRYNDTSEITENSTYTHRVSNAGGIGSYISIGLNAGFYYENYNKVDWIKFYV